MAEFGQTREPLNRFLERVIRVGVRALALLMTLVILLGVADVGWTLYRQLLEPPLFALSAGELLATFGAFMAVLIAIEIFINITLYLRDDVIHVETVMATALMAIARKVIILDINDLPAAQVLAIAATVIAMSVGYWLVRRTIQDSKTPLTPTGNEAEIDPQRTPAPRIPRRGAPRDVLLEDELETSR